MGIAALILAIVSAVFSFFSLGFWWISFPCGIAAIILGALSKNSGVGKAGMIIGIVAVAISFIIFVACGGCYALELMF